MGTQFSNNTELRLQAMEFAIRTQEIGGNGSTSDVLVTSQKYYDWLSGKEGWNGD